MRLIDADTLIKDLKNKPNYQITVPIEMYEAVKKLIQNHQDLIIDVINEQPLAYDVDAMVEELRETTGNKTQFEQGFHSALNEVENYGKVPTREYCN